MILYFIHLKSRNNRYIRKKRLRYQYNLLRRLQQITTFTKQVKMINSIQVISPYEINFDLDIRNSLSLFEKTSQDEELANSESDQDDNLEDSRVMNSGKEDIRV